MHYFYSKGNCAVLDILLPNYDNESRFCNFYEFLDKPPFETNKNIKLKMIDGFPDKYDIEILELDK